MTGAPNVPLVPIFQNAQVGVPGHWNVEFSVDIEMVIAMAPGISNIILYEYVDTNGNEVVTDEEMYQEMASPTYGEPRPNQISTSWSVDNSPAATNYLRQLMVQGQSFFYASGDGGAWPIKTNNWPGFNYITLVGGTSLLMNSTGVSWNAESAWGGSSGGIFTGLPIPFYQKGINMTGNQGSTQCRNAPDVAMSADNNLVVNSYQPTNGSRQTLSVGVIGGTSCAAPLWAAFTALVNQQAAEQDRPSVGFLNPALYAIGQSVNYTNCFHDITVGNNTTSGSPNAYYATNGYDLCTGWGSPNGNHLLNTFVALCGPVIVDFNYTGTTNNGTWDYPYKNMAQGTSAVSNNGTIFIINGGSSSERPVISKPMTITAENGPSTIGN
jgi:subtilase family serine protease